MFEDSFDKKYRQLAYSIPVDALLSKKVSREKRIFAREFRGLEPIKKDTSNDLLSVSDSKMFKWWDKGVVGLTPLYLASLDFADKIKQNYLILRKIVF